MLCTRIQLRWIYVLYSSGNVFNQCKMALCCALALASNLGVYAKIDWPRSVLVKTRGGIMVSHAYTYKYANQSRFDETRRARWSRVIRSGSVNFDRNFKVKIHSNYNMACITISARSNKFASKWRRFWSKTNWKRFQITWRWILGEKQFRGYRSKFWIILEIRGQCGSVAKYVSDRQFYLWHLVYLDRLFLLSNLTWV